MKYSKLCSLILAAAVCLIFSACSNQAADGASEVSTSDVVDSDNLEENSKTESTSNDENAANVSNASQADANVDVDLTKMSSTMVYGQVFDIMTNPDDYAGKTLKIRGQYYGSYYEPTGRYYHVVLIKDATACCSQGMEFVWDEDTHVYPDEYPSNGTEVEITGIFETYTEEGEIYARLLTDDIVLVDS